MDYITSVDELLNMTSQLLNKYIVIECKATLCD